MASISEIVQADSYRGQAEAGGGFGFGVNIDVTPIQRLATFKYYDSQAKWQEQKKQDSIAADNIGKIAAFDITTPLTPYSEELKTKLKNIQDYASANPDALTYSRNPEKYQELNKMVNDFQTLRKSATASDAVYNARLKKINEEQDPNKKAILAKELDLDVKDLFADGVESAKNKILNTAADLNPDNFKLPTAPVTTMDVLAKDANETYTIEYKFINKDQLDGNAELLASGFNTPAVDENNPSFKALSKERQQLERDKANISQATRNSIIQTSEKFNSLLKAYKEANPNVDITKITGEPTGDTLSDIIKAANKYNSQIDQLNELIISGKLKDPTGKVITKPFTKYNLTDGLSPAEIISMHTLQKSGDSIWSLTKKITQTNDAQQSAQLAETRRHNKAQENLEGAALKQKKDEWNAKMSVGEESVKNSALERAKRIYGDLQKLTDKNGVISPDKIRSLNSEQLKYLGTEVTETNTNTGISKTSFQPLDLSVTNSDGEVSTEYAIQLINGEVKVLRPKPGKKNLEKSSDGFYVGNWDNTKSTNIFNMGTNILNEELQKAGSKELNSYAPIDFGDLQNTTSVSDSKKVSVSAGGSSEKPVDYNKLDPKGFKKEGNNYRYKDGTLFDAKGNIIK